MNIRKEKITPSYFFDSAETERAYNMALSEYKRIGAELEIEGALGYNEWGEPESFEPSENTYILVEGFNNAVKLKDCLSWGQDCELETQFEDWPESELTILARKENGVFVEYKS